MMTAIASTTAVDMKTPLGQLLLTSGAIIPHDLELALEHQRHTKELIGEVLLRIGAVSREQLDAALGIQVALLVA